MSNQKWVSTADDRCPMCCSRNTVFFTEDRNRAYFCCTDCHLVFVPSQWHLSARLEKQEYDKHENELHDPGYRRFLRRLAEPLLARLPTSPSAGLDFGCGPVPALAAMMEEHGFQMALYDKYYFPQLDYKQRRYQFITATEVVEHLASPGAELSALWQCLQPKGVLGIMTKRWLSKDRFSTWHYKNDLTHISFFHLNTFEWLASQWSAELLVPGDDVILLIKP